MQGCELFETIFCGADLRDVEGLTADDLDEAQVDDTTQSSDNTD